VKLGTKLGRREVTLSLKLSNHLEDLSEGGRGGGVREGKLETRRQKLEIGEERFLPAVEMTGGVSGLEEEK
jgi:hypothetical protein